MWTGNFGVVPLFCGLRLRALPLRALRTLRAIRVFPVRDAMLTSKRFHRKFRDTLDSAPRLALSMKTGPCLAIGREMSRSRFIRVVVGALASWCFFGLIADFAAGGPPQVDQRIVERPILVLGEGEQRLLHVPGLRKFSLGSPRVQAIRPPVP